MPPAAPRIEATRSAAWADLDTAPGARLSPAAAAPPTDARRNTSRPPVLSRLAAAGDSRAPAHTALRVEGSSRSARTVLAGVGAVAVLAGLVLFCFDPKQHHFYPLCFFHKTTGLLCPGCGALRGLHQLLHGHLAAAFQLNPMLIASLPFLFWFGARFALQKARTQPLSLGLRPGWLWLMLGAVLAVSVLRNLPGAPFAMLRP